MVLVSGAIAVTEIEPTDGRERRALNSLLVADFVEAVVNVRQVIRRHIVDEGARDFVISNATVQPPQENCEVRGGSKDKRAPVRIEKCAHEKDLVSRQKSFKAPMRYQGRSLR